MKSRNIKFAGVRYCKRGMTERYHTQRVNGDLYNYNEEYKKAIDFVIDFKPDPKIKIWIDLNLPDFKKIIKTKDVEIMLNYPTCIEDVLDFLNITDKRIRNKVIKTKNLYTLNKHI